MTILEMKGVAWQKDSSVGRLYSDYTSMIMNLVILKNALYLFR